MTIFRACLIAASLVAAASMPTQARAQTQTQAQTRDEVQILEASNVGFFERTLLGDLKFSAVNIFYDDRCVDPDLCFRTDELLISVILFEQTGLKERVMRLGQTVRVPGGTLTFVGAGTPPTRQGAIPLPRYNLSFVFRPDPPDQES